jgi:1-phosphatidylinositol-3-phosphate 5-kinase
VYDGLPNTPDRPYTFGQSTTGTPYVYSSIDTHLELLSNLEKIKTSTTPGLVIPAPILLQRVKKEEDHRHERVTNGTMVSASGHNTPDDFGDRPSGNRLGGDLRTGLKGLRSGLDTFEGWSRLQRLDTVRCIAVDETKHDLEGQLEPTSARVCDKPQTESLVFYDPDSDTSILDLLRTLKMEMGDMAACARSGCVATAHDHKRCWYHAEKKVTLRATPMEEVEGKSETALRAWASCAVCKCASDSKVMTDTAV